VTVFNCFLEEENEKRVVNYENDPDIKLHIVAGQNIINIDETFNVSLHMELEFNEISSFLLRDIKPEEELKKIEAIDFTKQDLMFSDLLTLAMLPISCETKTFNIK
jgi:hypothetical protein